MLRPDALNIFTDASLYRSEKKGGTAAIFVYFGRDGIPVEVAFELQGYKSTTINQMELQAVILAIGKIKDIEYSQRVSRAVVFTDSLYVVENYPRAVYDWSRNKWCNRDGKPMAYATQWKALLKAIKASNMRIDFQWIRGHSGNAYHNKADKNAKASAKALLEPPLFFTDVRRKKNGDEDSTWKRWDGWSKANN